MDDEPLDNDLDIESVKNNDDIDDKKQDVVQDKHEPNKQKKKSDRFNEMYRLSKEAEQRALRAENETLRLKQQMAEVTQKLMMQEISDQKNQLSAKRLQALENGDTAVVNEMDIELQQLNLKQTTASVPTTQTLPSKEVVDMATANFRRENTWFESNIAMQKTAIRIEQEIQEENPIYKTDINLRLKEVARRTIDLFKDQHGRPTTMSISGSRSLSDSPSNSSIPSGINPRVKEMLSRLPKEYREKAISELRAIQGEN
jgi:hypothetical protein